MFTTSITNRQVTHVFRKTLIGLFCCWIHAGVIFAETITYVDGEADPFTGVEFDGTQDTMIITNAGDQQDQNYGGYTIMTAGSAVNFGFGGPRRSLLRFDVSSFAGRYSRINSVTLRLTLTGAEGTGTVQVFQLADDNQYWVEGDENVDQQNNDDSGNATWDAQIQSLLPWKGLPGAGMAGVDYYVGALGQPLASKPFGVAPAIIDFPLTDPNIVDGWITSGTNAGFLLKSKDEIPGNRAYFLTSEYTDAYNTHTQYRPQLIIDYEPLIQVDLVIDSTIRLGSHGVIPIVILSTDTFDARTIDPASVSLAGASVAVVGKADKTLSSIEDVNADGLEDLQLKIDSENLDTGAIQSGLAVLVGETYAGDVIQGTATVTIVPPE